jgi:type IV secretion system protein VirB9
MKPLQSILCAGALAMIEMPSHADAQTRRPHAETPLETLASANAASRQRPTRDAFQAARHVYTYEPGAIYELYTNPNYVSTILLEPGETLNNIAAGDTSRWMVTQADSETESDGRTIVLVKPQSAGLRTNVVLITDRRTYLIEAVSQAGTAYSAQVAWSYPQAELEGAATPLDALNFNYRIRTTNGRRPVWLPSRVFDDGRRTWIEFAPDVAAGDMPPLFVVTEEGVELVNYRVLSSPNGQRYLVDRLFDVGELRLGTRSPIIVRIERNPAPPAPRPRSTHR